MTFTAARGTDGIRPLRGTLKLAQDASGYALSMSANTQLQRFLAAVQRKQ
jgi:hypothetical protein